MAAPIKITPNATPTPIPAFAPVERPVEEDGLEVEELVAVGDWAEDEVVEVVLSSPCLTFQPNIGSARTVEADATVVVL